MDKENTQEQNLVLHCEKLSKSYKLGPETLNILADVDLKVHAGETLAIMGASGAGKTTLLNLLGALDEADSGNVWIDGQSVKGLNESEKAVLRNKFLGFVFQFHHLLPEFSALENVAMPLWLRGGSRAQSAEIAHQVLARVGLEGRSQHKPAELSGGERQRVAIARALAGEPKILLMDEPTGNLDKKNAIKVLELIEHLNEETGSALIVVTHDPDIARHMNRSLELVEGQLSPI